MRISRECFFGPNLPKNRFLDRNFENLTPDLVPALPRYRRCQFSGKTNNFGFFCPNLPKNGFLSQNFKNLSPYLESAPLR